MLLHPGDPHGWTADWVCWNGVVTFGSFATAQRKVIEDHKYGQKEAQKNGEWLKQKAFPFFMLGFVCFFSSTCVGLCVTGRRLMFWVQFICHACVSSSIATLPVYLAYLALVELDKQWNSLKTNLWGEFSPSPREFNTPALLFHSKRNWWEEACLPPATLSWGGAAVVVAAHACQAWRCMLVLCSKARRARLGHKSVK